MVEILVPIQGVPLKAGATYIDPVTEQRWIAGSAVAPVDEVLVEEESLEHQLHAALKSSLEIDRFLTKLGEEHAEEIEPLQQESMLKTSDLSAQSGAETRWRIEAANARFERLRLAGLAEKQRLESEIEVLERLIAVGEED